MGLHTYFYKLSCIVHKWSPEYQRLPWNDFGNYYYMHTIYEELQIWRDLNQKKEKRTLDTVQFDPVNCFSRTRGLHN